MLVLRIQFDETYERIFGPDVGTDQAWEAVESASSVQHGAMIVISAAPDAEAARLSGQATLIVPGNLDADTVRNLCGIDGAMLFDPAGVCHAIAVILDGVATPEGDPARGARFNSAVRYLGTTEHKTMVCIVSEDGTIDVLPDFHPRIRHAEIIEALDELRRLSGAHQDGETFHNAWQKVESLAFYMNRAECDEANQLYESEQQARLAAGGFAIRGLRLEPNPAMDGSFFLADG